MPRSRTDALALSLTVAGIACGAPASRATPPGPTASSCPSDRAVVLASRADIARTAHCTTLSGLIIRSGAALDLSPMKALTAITGDLVIGPTVGIHEVTFPALGVVEGAVRVHTNSLLQGLFLPRLERAGSIDIDSNAALTTISLPRLASVRGTLHVTQNANVELVDISALQSIAQDLVITGAPLLTLLDAPQLETAASVQLDAPKLPSEVIDRLRATSTRR